jgi:hypothetical protein
VIANGQGAAWALLPVGCFHQTVSGIEPDIQVLSLFLPITHNNRSVQVGIIKYHRGLSRVYMAQKRPNFINKNPASRRVEGLYPDDEKADKYTQIGCSSFLEDNRTASARFCLDCLSQRSG